MYNIYYTSLNYYYIIYYSDAYVFYIYSSIDIWFNTTNKHYYYHYFLLFTIFIHTLIKRVTRDSLIIIGDTADPNEYNLRG